MAVTIAEFINKVGFKVNDGDVQKVNRTISGIKSTATKLLGAIGIGFSLSQLNALAEEFNGINDKLNYALEYSENMKDVQKEIVAAANNCKTSYGDMVDTIVNLKQANAEIFPVEEAATFVEYVNKLGKTAGYSDGEISSMQSSLQRVVATGTMGVADITRIARTTPALIEQLCNGLGVTREQLEAMANAGQITGETLKTAIKNSAETIDANFDRLDYSIGDAMLNIRNRWGYFVDDLNATTGFTQTIAKGMVSGFNTIMGVLNKVRNGIVWLTDKLGGMQNIMKLAGIVAGVIFTGKAIDGLMAFIKGFQTLDKTVLATKLKMLAIIAVIVLIALLVEDFINFMKGNDSVIGSLLEKAGIDVDKVRQTIIDAWGAIKSFLLAAWQTIKSACTNVWGFIKSFFVKHGDQIKSSLLAAWNLIKSTLVGLWNAIKTVATAVFGAMTAFWEKHGEQIKTSFINIWTGIQQRLAVIWNLIKTIFSAAVAIIKAVVTTAFNLLRAFWETWGSTIIALLSGAWNTIKAVFSTALDVLTDLFAVFSDLFSGNWSQFWEDVKTLLSDIWNGILNIISTILSSVWDVTSNIFGVIANFISSTATGIWTTVTTAFSNMLKGIATTVGKIKSTIVEGFQAAIDWIKALPAQAVKWGSDIIDSIVQGITGAVDKVGDAVKGVADKISSFLHFSVPDEGPLSDFDRSMPDMMQLMAEGIRNGKSVVSNAIKGLTGDMSNDIQDIDIDGNPKPKPSGGAGAFFSDLVNGLKVFAKAASPQAGTVNTVSGSNNVSRSVVLNVEMNNKFEGDSAIQKKAASAMDKSAKDITAELARGLNFA